jgi:hypothetical protein
MAAREGVTGSAGLSFLRGTEPVIATAMTMGLMNVSAQILMTRAYAGTRIRSADCVNISFLAISEQVPMAFAATAWAFERRAGFL